MALLCSGLASTNLRNPRRTALRNLDAGAQLSADVDMAYFFNGPDGNNVSIPLLTPNIVTTDLTGVPTLPDGAADMTFNTAGKTYNLRGPVRIGGVFYAASTGISSIRFDNTATVTKRLRWTLGATKDKILAGFYVRANPEVDFSYTDLLNMENGVGNEWSVPQFKTFGTFDINAHSSYGTTSATSGNGFAGGDTLWVQQLYNRNVGGGVGNGTAETAVWLVGGTKTSPTFTPIGAKGVRQLNDTPCVRIYAPMIETHGQTSPTSPYYFSWGHVFKWGGSASTVAGPVDTLMI